MKKGRKKIILRSYKLFCTQDIPWCSELSHYDRKKVKERKEKKKIIFTSYKLSCTHNIPSCCVFSHYDRKKVKERKEKNNSGINYFALMISRGVLNFLIN